DLGGDATVGVGGDGQDADLAFGRPATDIPGPVLHDGDSDRAGDGAGAGSPGEGSQGGEPVGGTGDPGELVLSADRVTALGLAVLGDVVDADDGGAGGCDALGEKPHPGGDVGVGVELEPFGGHGFGDTVDDAQAVGGGGEGVGEVDPAIGVPAVPVSEWFVGPDVGEMPCDAVGGGAEREESGHDTPGVVLIVDVQDVVSLGDLFGDDGLRGPAFAGFGFALEPVDACPVDEGGLVGAIPNLGGRDIDAGESIGEIHWDPRGGPGVDVRRVDVCAWLGRVGGVDDDEVFDGEPGGEVV